MNVKTLIKEATTEANRMFTKDKEKWNFWMKILFYAKKLEELEEVTSSTVDGIKKYALDRFFGNITSSQGGTDSNWYRRVGKNYFLCGDKDNAYVGVVDGEVLVKFEKVISEEDKDAR